MSPESLLYDLYIFRLSVYYSVPPITRPYKRDTDESVVEPLMLSLMYTFSNFASNGN
jgi:hypothetical protein